MFGSVAARLAAVMAAAELGHDPDDLLASAERMGIDFDMFGAPRSNREIIQLHNAALRDSLRRLNSADSGLLLHTSFCGDTKPADEFPQPPPFAALMPISCADLQPGTTHRCVYVCARSLCLQLRCRQCVSRCWWLPGSSQLHPDFDQCTLHARMLWCPVHTLTGAVCSRGAWWLMRC